MAVGRSSSGCTREVVVQIELPERWSSTVGSADGVADASANCSVSASVVPGKAGMAPVVPGKGGTGVHSD